MADEMNKLTGTTPDLTKLNTEKVKELFPQAVTEGKIDFYTLKALLGDEVDDTHEKYQFTWHGKSKAIKLAQSPSTATLLPSKEDSKDWDTTENLYIEGDNLEVLKQLQKTYFGKIKMIYIDPPYNTGGDFVYKDDFKDTIRNYKEQTNQSHKANAETSGRYHTDWLNMMYPRLMLAKNLLSDDGVIFISIDDNEQSNLRKMCDEIFGESNYISEFIWHNNKKGRQMDKFVKRTSESVLFYVKDINKINLLDKQVSVNLSNYPYKDSVSAYKKGYPLHNGTAKFDINNRPNLAYSIYYNPITKEIAIEDEKIWTNDGKLSISETPKRLDLIKNGYRRIIPKKNKKYNSQRVWRWGKEKLIKDFHSEIIPIDEDENIYFYQKDRLDSKNMKIQKFTNYIDIDTSKGRSDLNKLFLNRIIFDHPKPIDLIVELQKIILRDFDIVLDFFSGSATTAHAVMKLNAEDGGNRKFIMVQLPEPTDEKSEAHKAGYKNICEIGKERIRRAGKQIQEDMIKDGKDISNLDDGFKVFKLDSTNIKEWDGSQILNEQTLLDYDNIFKDGRTQEDVLYEILLKYGVFNMPVKPIKLNDKTAYDIAEGNTLICLADDINEQDIQAIGKLKPQNVIFKESGFKDDNVKLNAIYTLEKQGVEDIQAI